MDPWWVAGPRWIVLELNWFPTIVKVADVVVPVVGVVVNFEKLLVVDQDPELSRAYPIHHRICSRPHAKGRLPQHRPVALPELYEVV